MARSSFNYKGGVTTNMAPVSCLHAKGRSRQGKVLWDETFNKTGQPYLGLRSDKSDSDGCNLSSRYSGHSDGVIWFAVSSSAAGNQDSQRRSNCKHPLLFARTGTLGRGICAAIYTIPPRPTFKYLLSDDSSGTRPGPIRHLIIPNNSV